MKGQESTLSAMIALLAAAVMHSMGQNVISSGPRTNCRSRRRCLSEVPIMCHDRLQLVRGKRRARNGNLSDKSSTVRKIAPCMLSYLTARINLGVNVELLTCIEQIRRRGIRIRCAGQIAAQHHAIGIVGVVLKDSCAGVVDKLPCRAVAVVEQVLRRILIRAWGQNIKSVAGRQYAAIAKTDFW